MRCTTNCVVISKSQECDQHLGDGTQRSPLGPRKAAELMARACAEIQRRAENQALKAALDPAPIPPPATPTFVSARPGCSNCHGDRHCRSRRTGIAITRSPANSPPSPAGTRPEPLNFASSMTRGSRCRSLGAGEWHRWQPPCAWWRRALRSTSGARGDKAGSASPRWAPGPSTAPSKEAGGVAHPRC